MLDVASCRAVHLLINLHFHASHRMEVLSQHPIGSQNLRGPVSHGKEKAGAKLKVKKVNKITLAYLARLYQVAERRKSPIKVLNINKHVRPLQTHFRW
jgi:hypothetical protein